MTAPAPPHPFPYQGSKRKIAPAILRHFPARVDTLIEPFCGAAAVSIAAAANGMVGSVRLNDLNAPLMNLWHEILHRPHELADAYDALWRQQAGDGRQLFNAVRAQFNQTHQPQHLLFLLARIVKGAVRYSKTGAFNQSPDNRRTGMKPAAMRQNIAGVSALLRGRTTLSAADFRQAIAAAGEHDLIYLDPPYQGTSSVRDHRYFDGLEYGELCDALSELNDRKISYLVSYDGITGNHSHGRQLPKQLRLSHLLINAGRSTQATLLGKTEQTVESLYLSPALTNRLQTRQIVPPQPPRRRNQISLPPAANCAAICGDFNPMC